MIPKSMTNVWGTRFADDVLVAFSADPAFTFILLLRPKASLLRCFRRLGEPSEIGQRVEGIDSVGVGDPFERVALDQPFDGDLELLARAGVGDGRHGDDVVGNVPG